MTASQPVVLYATEDPIARITLNRPEARNALSPEVIEALAASLLRAKQDPAVRVVVLTGAGDEAFCAGGDLGGRGLRPQSFLEQHDARGRFADLFRIMAALGKPIVARVNGYCLAGGFGLALACDLVVASNDSSFGTPEVKRGLMPMMIMATIIRNCGRKKALELILTGRRIPALEAERLGLINQAVPVEDLDAAVDALAGELAAMSPAVVRLGRDAFYTMADLEFENALAYLQTMLTLNLSTEDAREGVSAFLEKRPPQWKGR
jgi:enoyl-CoA hydratase/carnithine racemase